MQRHQHIDTRTTESQLGPSAVRTRCEQLCVRNYDEGRSYRVRISVSRPNASPRGEEAVRSGAPRTSGSHYEFETTYELPPGAVTTEMEVVPPGRYDVRVVGTAGPAGGGSGDTSTKQIAEAARCNVGEEPPQTIVVEVGNGIVSVTEGVLG